MDHDTDNDEFEVLQLKTLGYDWQSLKSENIPSSPRGWIQWKGTSVCMDVHCSCGYHGHLDADFTYFIKCPKCKQVFEVGENIVLYPVSEEELSFLRS